MSPKPHFSGSFEAWDRVEFLPQEIHEGMDLHRKVSGVRDVGLVKNTSPKVIAQGTDWRSLNDLRRQLNA